MTRGGAGNRFPRGLTPRDFYPLSGPLPETTFLSQLGFQGEPPLSIRLLSKGSNTSCGQCRACQGLVLHHKILSSGEGDLE